MGALYAGMMKLVWLLAWAAWLPGDCVPARWPADAATLPLLDNSPINCLLVEAGEIKPDFRAAAAKRTVLAVVHPGSEEQAAGALKAGADGLVLEGDFAPEERARLLKLDAKAIELRSRAHMDFTRGGVLGTAQAVWPGINTHDQKGAAESGPTGAPWIDTNAGFLRFARALAPEGTVVWLGNRPPAKTVIQAERYIQVIADAAMIGARWVLALDDDFFARLRAGDTKAHAGWRRIQQVLAFYENNSSWRTLKPYGQLAVVQDADTGGLLSGGILDMISVKHTPVVPVPKRGLATANLAGVKMTVNVDATALTDEQKKKLLAFTRGGGTLLSGPPGWRMPPPDALRITLAKEDVSKLDDIWREVNTLTGRRNLGARLFNVASMLSHLTANADATSVVLHLVNYSGYPVDSVTVHLLGKFRSARLVTPEEPAGKALKLYDHEDGSGVDIDTVTSVAALILER